jgi:hypothetical protein
MVYYMSNLADDVEVFYKKVRPTNPIIKQILDGLVALGKLPNKHTGEVTIKINMDDGGVSESTLSVTEKLK